MHWSWDDEHGDQLVELGGGIRVLIWPELGSHREDQLLDEGDPLGVHRVGTAEWEAGPGGQRVQELQAPGGLAGRCLGQVAPGVVDVGQHLVEGVHRVRQLHGLLARGLPPLRVVLLAGLRADLDAAERAGGGSPELVVGSDVPGVRDATTHDVGGTEQRADPVCEAVGSHLVDLGLRRGDGLQLRPHGGDVFRRDGDRNRHGGGPLAAERREDLDDLVGRADDRDLLAGAVAIGGGDGLVGAAHGKLLLLVSRLGFGCVRSVR